MNVSQPALQPQLDLTGQELFHRLGWFIRLRWLAGLGCTGVILFARHAMGVDAPMRKLVGTILFVLVYNAFCALAVRVIHLSQPVSRRSVVLFANVQIALDLVALSLLLHFAGGVENFFLVFYIFHMVIACELLSRTNAMLQATLAAGLFNAVAWLEAFGVASHVHLDPIVPRELYKNRLFVFEVSFVLTATLYITVYLAGSISARLRQREREIEQANLSLRSLDKQKSFFMRKASHEMRAPLAAMQSLLQAAQVSPGGGLSHQQHDLIQRADNRAAGLLMLVDELLRYSRLRAATGLGRRETVPLSDLARKVVDLFAPMAEERKIDLRAESGRAVVDGDEEGLEELVTNLVSNAVRYTPEGGSVFVRTASDAKHVRLEVSDTGIGIEPQELPHIFEEFHRSSRAKSFEPSGAGLGMAIAKWVVEMHRGEIRVESTPGVGTTFRVTLPIAAPAEKLGAPLMG